MAPRLFTVVIVRCVATRPRTRETVTYYEADFAGIHFSRSDEANVIRYVRQTAKRVYGPDTQVIFLHTEGQ